MGADAGSAEDRTASFYGRQYLLWSDKRGDDLILYQRRMAARVKGRSGRSRGEAGWSVPLLADPGDRDHCRR